MARASPSVHSSLISQILARLGPRLERFLFTSNKRSPFHVLDLDWTHLISLHSLTIEIPNAGNLVEVLRRLPSQLVSLRLLDSPNGFRRGLLELAREWPASMSTLRTMTLPWCTKYERTEMDRLCAERGALGRYRNVDLDWWEGWEDLVLYYW